ncbi:Gfo/Idh/MocA family protein [Actinomadura scrupuli]|uniref:Gfo/Idh/MocA family protein n=1 Tax=Actinomadura scrupuli TaxID=559629 RepID=UPI003D991B79
MAVAIGLAGAGPRAREVHAPYLAACPGAEFAGVWARSTDQAGRLAAKYGVPVFDRYEELLDHCDAVTLAVSPVAQPDLAVAAARRSTAMLLEIPISVELAGAEQAAEAVALSHVVSQLGLTWRYAPSVRDFLGTAVARTGRMGGSGRVLSGPPPGPSPESRSRFELGVLAHQGPHLLDLLEAALGTVAGVSAHGDPEGWVGLMLEHQGGRFSEASLSAAVQVEPRATIEVFGPGGAAEIDCAQAVGPDAFENMFQEFADAVAQGTPPELNAEHGLHLQRLVTEARTDLLRQ